MIETLRIADIAIVDEALLEFGPALNVLTGETGAGKSIVLGALSLLAGGRASTDRVGFRIGMPGVVLPAVDAHSGHHECRPGLPAVLQ